MNSNVLVLASYASVPSDRVTVVTPVAAMVVPLISITVRSAVSPGFGSVSLLNNDPLTGLFFVPVTVSLPAIGASLAGPFVSGVTSSVTVALSVAPDGSLIV